MRNIMFNPPRWMLLGWGKLRRTFLVKLRKRRVLQKLKRREGSCLRCGACCKLFYRCPAYDESCDSPRCLAYDDRPGVCGLFPLDEKDLRERGLIMPGTTCGYRFSDAPNGNGSNGVDVESIRWGPSRRKANGKPKIVTGALAVLVARFRQPDGQDET